MIQAINNWFNDYWAWGLSLIGLVTGLSWIPGVGTGISLAISALKIFASLFESLSPLINALFSGLIYVWQNVLFPGFKNILSSVPTIITVLIIVGAMYMYLDLKYKVATHNLNREVSSIKRVVPKTEDIQPEEFNPTKLLPWNW